MDGSANRWPIDPVGSVARWGKVAERVRFFVIVACVGDVSTCNLFCIGVRLLCWVSSSAW